MRSVLRSLEKTVNPDDTWARYTPGGFFLPRHLVPAPLFNEFRSHVAISCLKFLDVPLMIRGVHELRGANRRPARQDRFIAHHLGRIGGAPPPQLKPMIIATAAPPTIPQNPYVNFASVTGVIDPTSQNVGVSPSPLHCLLFRQSKRCVPRPPRYRAQD